MAWHGRSQELPARRAESGLTLDPSGWAFLVLAAVLVGFAKTATGGLGSVAVVLFAVVLPARKSPARSCHC
jgi:hypothetical protein